MIRRAAYLGQMLRNETLPAAVLSARQARSINALVRHAAVRVPFYRDLYRARGIDVTSFDAVRDLHKLPIVDKRLLRAAGDDCLSLDAPATRVTIRTSGSTGEPFSFQIDRSYDQWRKAQYLRPYFSCGRGLTDKVMRLMAFPSQRSSWVSKLGLLREWQFDCAADPQSIAAAWWKLAPDVLQGYPSSLRVLAQHCLDAGQPLSPAPRRVFTDSEQLTPDTRALLERAFASNIIDIFGTFETDNIAYQCASGAGYHITTDSVLLEILNDGQPVAPGEEGDIVVTVLANRTTPFIRYNLRDRGRLATQSCTCGRAFPLLALIQGRADDFIVLANGERRTSMEVLGRLDGFTDAVIHYQLRQIEPQRFDLLLVPSGRFTPADRQQILRAIMPALAPAQVELHLVETIPQDPSGKLRAFVSKLGLRAHA